MRKKILTDLIEKKDLILNFLKSLNFDISKIKNESIMFQCFVHKSFSADFIKNIYHNERLEFFWDSILWFVISNLLFENFPKYDESKLTLLKIALVREETLASVAIDIWLDKIIFLWKWEERSWWRLKNVILCDCLEALISFVYLEFWIEKTIEFIKNYVYIKLEYVKNINIKSFKSLLQELVQKLNKNLPEYIETEHELNEKWIVLQYKSQVFINNELFWEWFWQNKKKAQEEAAKNWYESYLKKIKKN